MPELLYRGGAPRTAGVNIFDPAQSSDPAPPGEIKPRFIGSFEVDLYQYPPAFLALPRPAVAAGLDFLTIRRLWFAVQSVVLFMAVGFLARSIGGPSGLLALLLAPVLWLAVTTRLGLQIGNFQLTAFAMAVLAMIAFDRGHAARGGLALGFPAVSKVPGRARGAPPRRASLERRRMGAGVGPRVDGRGVVHGG